MKPKPVKPVLPVKAKAKATKAPLFADAQHARRFPALIDPADPLRRMLHTPIAKK